MRLTGRSSHSSTSLIHTSVHVHTVSSPRSASAENSLSLALKPSAGEPVGQVSNSHGWRKGWGVALDEPVPDSFSAGADSTTCNQSTQYSPLIFVPSRSPSPQSRVSIGGKERDAHRSPHRRASPAARGSARQPIRRRSSGRYSPFRRRHKLGEGRRERSLGGGTPSTAWSTEFPGSRSRLTGLVGGAAEGAVHDGTSRYSLAVLLSTPRAPGTLASATVRPLRPRTFVK